MSIFDTSTPGSGDANPGGVAAPVVPEPSADSGGAAVTPPVEPSAPVEGAPAPQYLDLEQYGNHLVKVKVDGEEKDLPFSKVRDGLMMQEAFTKRTQELADARRRLGQADALVSALEANPAATIMQLSEVYDLDPANGFNPVQRAPEEQRLVQRERQLAAQETQIYQQRIEAELAAIRAIQPDVDVQALAAYAHDNQVPLPLAHKLMLADELQAKQQQQAANDAARQAASAAQIVHGGGATAAGTVTQPSTPANSIREAWARAKQSQHTR